MNLTPISITSIALKKGKHDTKVFEYQVFKADDKSVFILVTTTKHDLDCKRFKLEAGCTIKCNEIYFKCTKIEPSEKRHFHTSYHCNPFEISAP